MVTGTPASEPGLGIPRVPLLRLIGQIAATYLVAEGPDGLYLIDQHAAHERVLFEKFIAQQGQEVASQALLQPATVELAPGSARMLGEQLTFLSRLEFQIETFGPNTFLVRSLPALLAGSDPAAVVRSVVEDLEEDENSSGIPDRGKTHCPGVQARRSQGWASPFCGRAAHSAGKPGSL